MAVHVTYFSKEAIKAVAEQPGAQLSIVKDSELFKLSDDLKRLIQRNRELEAIQKILEMRSH